MQQPLRKYLEDMGSARLFDFKRFQQGDEREAQKVTRVQGTSKFLAHEMELACGDRGSWGVCAHDDVAGGPFPEEGVDP